MRNRGWPVGALDAAVDHALSARSMWRSDQGPFCDRDRFELIRMMLAEERVLNPRVLLY